MSKKTEVGGGIEEEVDDNDNGMVQYVQHNEVGRMWGGGGGDDRGDDQKG